MITSAAYNNNSSNQTKPKPLAFCLFGTSVSLWACLVFSVKRKAGELEEMYVRTDGAESGAGLCHHI